MLSWLRLIRSRRVGPGTFVRLMADHGTAGAALAALPSMARAAGVGGYAVCPRDTAAAEMDAAHAAGADMLCLGDPRYPAALAAISDAPPVLWVRGQLPVLDGPAIAMVGARNASSLGLRMARALAEGLGRVGFCIVSGLARGIDTAAHTAALPTGTVAVCAGGVDVVYPAENAPLAARIAQTGLLVSEQPMGLAPQARHFPRRNRLISGLSLGLVVVEAAQRSGSLITVRDALDQGREVMAVPGHPFDGRAEGCNALIREGATLVRDAADVRAALARALEEAGAAPIPLRRPPAPRPAPPPRPAPATAEGLAQRILDRLGPSPLAEDQLIRDLALPAALVSPGLLLLELDGRVARAPGGLISRID